LIIQQSQNEQVDDPVMVVESSCRVLLFVVLVTGTLPKQSSRISHLKPCIYFIGT